jgi:hypothetical protein
MSPERTAAPELTAKALRQLFLTLFLRGRSARGLRKSSVPKSIRSKLAWLLALYALLGMIALLARESVFTLSVSLHATTFLFVGMFVASSAGEVLFNQDEADILLHRPVLPRVLLWAKIRVLVLVSLWLAGAFNLIGLGAGVWLTGNWAFPLVHALSLVLETLFCVSCVVLVYQLCLRWFGRERLDALLTTTQVIVAAATMIAGQVVPQLMRSMHDISLRADSWWLGLAPPVWFAALDDAVAGSGNLGSWLLAGLGLAVTLALSALAFGKLAADYGRGLQLLSEARAPVKERAQRRWFDRVVSAPPLSWWLRDSVTRAAFLLIAAYLVRDRDVKLRVYPSLAPLLAMPAVFLLRAGESGGSVMVAISGAFLGLTPLTALGVLRFSQHWQATEIFRAAPIAGPGAIFRGARRAVMLVLALPMLLLFGVTAALLSAEPRDLLLMLPGLLAMPLYPLFLSLSPDALPLSQPAEEANAAARGLQWMAMILLAMVIAVLGVWARSVGWMWWLLLAEAITVMLIHLSLRSRLGAVGWSTAE